MNRIIPLLLVTLAIGCKREVVPVRSGYEITSGSTSYYCVDYDVKRDLLGSLRITMYDGTVGYDRHIVREIFVPADRI